MISCQNIMLEHVCAMRSAHRTPNDDGNALVASEITLRGFTTSYLYANSKCSTLTPFPVLRECRSVFLGIMFPWRP